MSKITADSLKPHLSALVDGELEPIEAIALQQHLRHAPALEAECRELERLKLAVHLAGTRDRVPVDWGLALESKCRAHFKRRSERQTWRWALPIGAFGAAAVGLVVASASGPSSSPTPSNASSSVAFGAASPFEIQPVAMRTDNSDRVLARLVGVHRKGGSRMGLSDLSSSGALVTFERLPDSFIVPEGQRAQLIQASYMGCNEREGGSTLAVLRADRVDLPARIDNALDATGVYVDTIDGVQVRVSVSGDKLFVLLSGDGTSGPDPI